MKKFFIGMVLTLICSSWAGSTEADVQLALTPGLVISSNPGEHPYSFALQGTALFGNRYLKIEISPYFDASKKYTNHGWIAGTSADTLIFFGDRVFLDIGGRYAYRNGGSWVKQAVFLRFGAGMEFVTLSNYRSKPATPDQREVHQVRLLYSRETFSWNSLNQVEAVQVLYRNDWKLSKNQNNKWYARMEIAPSVVWYLHSDGTGPRQTGFVNYFWFGLTKRF